MSHVLILRVIMSMITCVSCLNSTICLIFWWSTTRNLVNSTNVCNHRIVNPKGLVLILWVAFRGWFARCCTVLVAFGCESLVVYVLFQLAITWGRRVLAASLCELFSFSTAFLHSGRVSCLCACIYAHAFRLSHVPSLNHSIIRFLENITHYLLERFTDLGLDY